jgi:hypothetical protein
MGTADIWCNLASDGATVFQYDAENRLVAATGERSAADAIPAIVGRDTGNAVENENRVRRENGLPLRPADPCHEE